MSCLIRDNVHPNVAKSPGLICPRTTSLMARFDASPVGKVVNAWINSSES
jgi:hypothetical protein